MKNKFLKLTTLPLVSTIVLTPIITLSNTQCSKDKTKTYHLKSVEQTENFLTEHETPLKGSYDHNDMLDYLKDNLKLQNIVNAFVFLFYIFEPNYVEIALEIHPSENYFTILIYWNTEIDGENIELNAFYVYYKDNQLTIKCDPADNRSFGDCTNAYINDVYNHGGLEYNVIVAGY
jgi:hypothetical protein